MQNYTDWFVEWIVSLHLIYRSIYLLKAPLWGFLFLLQTHYDILGISVNATDEQIKSAFRRLAKLYHPDKNPNGKDQFEKILLAYEILID